MLSFFFFFSLTQGFSARLWLDSNLFSFIHDQVHKFIKTLSIRFSVSMYILGQSRHSDTCNDSAFDPHVCLVEQPDLHSCFLKLYEKVGKLDRDRMLRVDFRRGSLTFCRYLKIRF